MGLLDGQRAVVTGGAGGIGATTAGLMVSEGARVAVVDRDLPGAEAVADEIGAVAFAADVRDPDAVTAAFDWAADALGGLSVVFNNAGSGLAQAAAHLHTGRGRPAARREPQGHLQRAAGRGPATAGRWWREHREHGVGERSAPDPRRGALCGGQGRGDRADHERGPRVRARRHPGQLRVARLHPHAAHRASRSSNPDWIEPLEAGHAARAGRYGRRRRRGWSSSWPAIGPAT